MLAPLIFLVASALAAQASMDFEESSMDVPPAPMVFNEAELQRLRAGQTIYRVEDPGGKRIAGLSATVASADSDVLWEYILDFDAYVDFLPYITASSTGARSRGPVREDIVASLELTTMGVVTRYNVENHWFPGSGYMSWCMTPRSLTPVHEVLGTWRLSPFEGSTERTLLEYRVEARMRWWIPDFLQIRAANRGLPTLVQLIRNRAEASGG